MPKLTVEGAGEFFEFDPIEPVPFSEITALKKTGLFSYFETYGLRFHAAAGDRERWARERPELERRFTAAEIRSMMEAAGLERVSLSDEPPYWCAIGYRRG